MQSTKGKQLTQSSAQQPQSSQAHSQLNDLESETFCWWKGQFVGEGPQEELDEGLRVPRALGTLVDSLVCCTGGTMSLTWASGAGESQWPGALLVMGGSMGVVSYAVGWAFRWRSGLLSSSILTWTICMGIWALWDWVNYAEVVGLTAFAFSCATLHMVLLKSALTNSPPLLYALLFILVTVSIPSVASVVDEDTSTAVIVIFCLLLAWLEALIVSTHTRLMVWHLQRGRVSLREVSRTAEDEAASCKKSFAVQVLHDVGTPLAMFALGVESIKTVSTLGAEHLETLRTLDCAIELMTLTRRKAIDFAQSMSGKPLVMRLGSTDVRDLVECKCRRIMSGFNTSHRVPIYYQVDRDVANYIITDGNVLWECLLNYLSNAVKFTNKGEIQCNVYRVTAATLRFEVRDTGIGIDHGARHRLFIPFVQLHQFGGGLGLGLWSVKQKITALHGSVGLHDTPGGGTTFFFDVPYKPDFVLERAMEDMKVSSIPEVDPVPDSSSVKAIGMTPTGADSATEQYLHPALAMKRRRVLVVDGRPLAYKCAHKLLVDKGFQVDYASNGRQGLLKMQQRIYTAVLVDCSITVLDVHALVSKFRGWEVTSAERVPLDRQFICVIYPEDTKPQELNSIVNAGVDAIWTDPDMPDGNDVMTMLEEEWESRNTPKAQINPSDSSVDVAPTSTTPPSRQASPGVKSLRSSCGLILLVEDERSILLFEKKMFEKFGYEVHTADNGEEGLQRMIGQAYSAVFTDILMPVMDGYEMVRRYRQWEARSGRPDAQLIFAVSAHDSYQDHAIAESIGMDGFISKPVQVKVMIDLVESRKRQGNAPLKAPTVSAAHRDHRISSLA